MRALILLLITASALAGQRGGGAFNQQHCSYWLGHFNNLENARLKLEELRESRANPILIWMAKRKLEKIFLKQQWDAFGELVDGTDAIYPDNEDNPEAPWFERPRWK